MSYGTISRDETSEYKEAIGSNGKQKDQGTCVYTQNLGFSACTYLVILYAQNKFVESITQVFSFPVLFSSTKPTLN